MRNLKKLLVAATVFLTIMGNTGCATHHTNLRSSFVKVHVATSISVCEAEEKCVDVAAVNTSGSGAIVSNDRSFGGKPKTLVLTADHVCDTSGFEIPPHVLAIVQEKEGFDPTKLKVVKTVRMRLEDSTGRYYKVDKQPWVRNIAADICVVESSINAPALHIAKREPEFGDKILNIAAPGGFMMPSASGGAVFITDGRYSGSYMERGRGINAVYTLWAIGGSSGSPILNEAGEMIGMVSAIHKSFWPRGWAMMGPQPMMPIEITNAASPLTIGPTLSQVRETIKAAINAANRGEPFIFPSAALENLNMPLGTEEQDNGLIYPLFVVEE